MRKFFTIVLFFGVLAMNTNVICQSLCLSGHGDMTNEHSSHTTAGHDMPKGEICPATDNDAHHSHHDMPQTSLKCDCSTDQAVALGFELTIAGALTDLKPPSRIISKIHSQKVMFLSNIPAPLEGPPKLVS